MFATMDDESLVRSIQVMSNASALAQVKTFIGYETVIHDAVESAEKQANIWMAQHRLPVEMVSVAAQTIAEVTPSHDQVFYIHVITVMYPRPIQ
jgi:hypothetical protein